MENSLKVLPFSWLLTGLSNPHCLIVTDSYLDAGQYPAEEQVDEWEDHKPIHVLPASHLACQHEANNLLREGTSQGFPGEPATIKKRAGKRRDQQSGI